MQKSLIKILDNPHGHWVGDGFPVQSLFGYQRDTELTSPFLLFDHAGPYAFSPNDGPPRGVGQHPHRGFETVTIVYDGSVSHRDSAGGGGTIATGDVQWMTAAGGIIHEEFHSEDFGKAGGPFHMVQLWVNLPAKDKMGAPGYQALRADQMGQAVADGQKVRVIAGTLNGVTGPARTHTPINMWDMHLAAGHSVTLPVPEGHNSLVAVLTGAADVAGHAIGSSQIAALSSDGAGVSIQAQRDAMILILTGEPIAEPVVGYGPFVMNTQDEIRTAIHDFNQGRFGAVTGA